MSGPNDTVSDKRYNPLAQLIAGRVIEFIREPAAVFWVYGFPLIMVVALGTAFRNRPIEESFEIVIKNGPYSEAVLAPLQTDERFDAGSFDEVECLRRLRVGKADLYVIPAGESKAVYRYDPSKSSSVLARNAVDDALQRAKGRQDVLEVSNQEITEPGGRYIDFLVPGLLGMGLMGGGLWGVGFATVDMRIRKLLKRYLATPMKRGHFLLSMMCSRLIFMVPEILVLLLFARLFFGVEIRGSYLALVLLILLGGFQFAGIGLLVGCRAQTLETVSGLMNLVMLPMWMASGIFFSVERFPDAMQPFIAVLPLTPLINALRAVMLEGNGLVSLGAELALMAAWGVVTFALALRWFRWN
jgi:ABC-type multidrug transport system permease subunit